MAPEEIVTATRVAIEELGRLDAKGSADREAFHRTHTDLSRSIAQLDAPLPEPPATD